MTGRTLAEIDIILGQKDERIEELEAKLSKLEYEDEWRWRQIRQLSDEENMQLPLPRLEIRHRRPSKYTHFMDYGLVYKHFLGHIEFIPISCTKTSGVSQGNSSSLYLPHRDGAHIYNDIFEFGLRGFLVDGFLCRELLLTDPDLPYLVDEKVKRRRELSEGS